MDKYFQIKQWIQEDVIGFEDELQTVKNNSELYTDSMLKDCIEYYSTILMTLKMVQEHMDKIEE